MKTEVSKSSNKNEIKLGAFFVIDIDYFKQVNDNYGHERGDTVIRSVAKVLQNTFGDENEIVARIGGDEFAAFCPDINDNLFIENKCQKIRNLMQEVRYAEDKPPVTLSIGIVNFRYGEDDSQFSDLFNRADNALYDVKARGRNGYEICE
ncbi:hypothetical protein AGMMS49938_18640 [Fibrobacterales bacterium]|nr:hypothetical protein AGMMS49938_18640 [Fibrobacterales bacterium]